MRIAVGGIHTESSTFSPVLTRGDDFRVLRGDALPAHEQFHMLRGFAASFVPLLHARAIPGGPVERSAYDALKAEFLQRLADALPCDGIYLAMHGALYVDGMDDAEGDWISATRALAGPDVPISVSYDLHGNVSRRVIDQTDMFAAYRTAPHIDVAETQTRAVAMLVRALETGERPAVAFCPVPVLLPGERTSTEDEPAKSLYALLPGVDARPGIWDSNIMVGYVWADEPRATACAVVTGTDHDAIANAARELAQRYFDAREEFRFGPRTGTIAECLGWAAEAAAQPVVLADSGDNPTGGGAGDRADVLRHLLATGAPGATVFAGIADLPATDSAFAAGIGAQITVSIGATLDSLTSSPVTVCGVVRVLDAGADASDRRAVIEAGNILVVVTARRRPFHMIKDFASLGIDPMAQKLIVVKSGYLSPELQPLAKPNLMALSPGVVNQDIPALPVQRIQRPCFPHDRDFGFAPDVYFSKRSGA